MAAGQFHIGPQGPGRCEASVGKCPYGGEDGDANHFDSYEEFERSQQACLIGVADFYPVVKLAYNGHELDYQGTYGDVFFHLMKQDLTQYQN